MHSGHTQKFKCIRVGEGAGSHDPRLRIPLVNVVGIEAVTPCLQSRPGKTLNALSGVAYTENQRNSRSSNVPKLYRKLDCTNLAVQDRPVPRAKSASGISSKGQDVALSRPNNPSQKAGNTQNQAFSKGKQPPQMETNDGSGCNLVQLHLNWRAIPTSDVLRTCILFQAVSPRCRWGRSKLNSISA